MVRVFIVYGGKEGERIGSRVHNYFKANNIGVFLASPKSADLHPSEKWEDRINRELKDAHLAVIIVTDGLKSSAPAKREINRIIDVLKYPYLPFVRKGVRPPKKLARDWNVFFNSPCARKNELIELELRMWRYYDEWNAMQAQSGIETAEITAKVASGIRIG
ncbi:MAG: TIR domain-containing protein [Nitrososphaera sp.]